MITITEKAAIRLRRKIETSQFKNSPGVGIRLGVKAGGCSGFIYMPLDVESGPDKKYDAVSESHGIRIFVFKRILPIVDGTEIDHSSENLLESFIFNNPNAKTSCGCGISFELKDKKDVK
ncbi:MAG: iron-sulfur cluster assembly accessory protein [bacterium]|nr:iron-sulfur cluster assembly accessory protein [bacterium]